MTYKRFGSDHSFYPKIEIPRVINRNIRIHISLDGFKEERVYFLTQKLPFVTFNDH